MTGFRYDSALSDMGEAQRIWDMYEGGWKDDDYVAGAPIEERMAFQYQRGRERDVDKYQRSEIVRVLWSDPWSYHREFNRIVLIEGDHGYWKQHVGISEVEGRPMEYIECR